MLVYGQMNEPPGARWRVPLTALTMAEYFRDERHQNVLLLMDNVFRFVQAGSEVSGLLGRLPSRVGYQPTLVSKGELMARLWPDTFVEEGNLKVQVATLRRALGDGHGGKRHLATSPGQGYRFVAPVTFVEEPEPEAPPAAPAKREHNLPSLLTRLIGRSETVTKLAEQLPRQRLLTIVGAGGIGKTSVALAVAGELVNAYEHGVWLIDLAPLADPRLVPTALAAAIGFEIRSDNPLPGLIAFLKDKHMLLVFENCEHVIEAAAALALAILKGAAGAHILATSREPLRVEGEHAHRLSALESPPASTRLGAVEALAFPAVELFVERAAASLGEFELGDADAPIVAEICRQLDGIPLAIEFAAARVDAFGVRGLAARLNDRLRLLTGGRRLATPRHQTMSATLDWSYGLLTEAEQRVLRRLAIFAGGFTLDAAGAVAADASQPEGDIINQVTELVAKLLVVAEAGDAEPRLRLLETTRAYALAKLVESGERDRLARRHAEYYRDLLASAAEDSAAKDEWPAAYAPEIDNIRAALEWKEKAVANLDAPPASRRTDLVRFGLDQRLNVLSFKANVLWLQGFPDQALEAARASVSEAQTLGHPVSLCSALAWGTALSLWVGDVQTAGRWAEELKDQAERHSLESYYPCALGFKGKLSAEHGDVMTAVQLLRAALEGLRETNYLNFYTVFATDLALSEAGRPPRSGSRGNRRSTSVCRAH